MITVWTKNLIEIKVYVITIVDQKNLEKATIFINNKGKRDDLSDAFLMTRYYIDKNT